MSYCRMHVRCLVTSTRLRLKLRQIPDAIVGKHSHAQNDPPNEIAVGRSVRESRDIQKNRKFGRLKNDMSRHSATEYDIFRLNTTEYDMSRFVAS